jgi:hypothetical protein
MNYEQSNHAHKFDFWKKQDTDPKETYLSYLQQAYIYWSLFGLLFIIAANVFSPVGSKPHLYKPEMTRVLYENDDMLTRILRDETTTGERK